MPAVVAVGFGVASRRLLIVSLKRCSAAHFTADLLVRVLGRDATIRNSTGEWILKKRKSEIDDFIPCINFLADKSVFLLSMVFLLPLLPSFLPPFHPSTLPSLVHSFFLL